MGHALPLSRKIQWPALMDRKFPGNNGFGDQRIEIRKREMPAAIFENRKLGYGG
jgi:hypothetical protein